MLFLQTISNILSCSDPGGDAHTVFLLELEQPHMTILLQSMPVRRDGRHLAPERTRKLGQRMEVQAIYDGDDHVRDGNRGAQPQ
jgi:hypothetical protein